MELNRDDILNAQDCKIEIVSIPEWGGDVGVRTMTGTQRDDLEALMRSRVGENTKDTRAITVALTLCHPQTGEALFTLDDVRALQGKNAVALDRVFKVASKLNLLTEEAIKAEAKN